jgi:hypothetical protein
VALEFVADGLLPHRRGFPQIPPLAHSYPIVGKLVFVVTEHADAVTIIPAFTEVLAELIRGI